MTAQESWTQLKDGFLDRAGKTDSPQELVSQHRMLMEQIRMQVVSSYPHEEVLRQAIILLFQQAQEGAGYLLCRGQPEVSTSGAASPKGMPALLRRVLNNPIVLYALLGAGVVLSFFAGSGAWKCAILFAAALAVAIFRGTGSEEGGTVEVKVPTNLEYVDSFITAQARLLDQHIEDLKLLIRDLTDEQPAEITADRQAAKICQYVWGNRISGMPTDQAYETAEDWLRRNGLHWQAYDEAHSHAFDVLPTKLKTTTFFPAILTEDGAVVCRGQYLKGPDA